MNNDELKSLLVKVLISAGSIYATKYGIDGDTLNTVVGSVVAIGSAAYGIYSHRNMKKVPSDATVILPKNGK
jgi:uncharacterized membrane protein YebE (DUF533 family)